MRPKLVFVACMKNAKYGETRTRFMKVKEVEFA